jgi:hypothetical protein
MENNFDFTNWVGRNHYQLIDIYAKYTKDRRDGEITPDYDTLVATKWTTFDEIPSIMADNDNEELQWCLDNSYTIEELYKLYLKTK